MTFVVVFLAAYVEYNNIDLGIDDNDNIFTAVEKYIAEKGCTTRDTLVSCWPKSHLFLLIILFQSKRGLKLNSQHIWLFTNTPTNDILMLIHSFNYIYGYVYAVAMVKLA